MGKAEETRNKLLEAGRQVALEGGASQLTLSTVAKRAGVSKGGILYHFGTKKSLLENLVLGLLDEFDKAVQEELEKGAKTWLLAYIRASFPSKRAAHVREIHTLFAILAIEPELLVLAQERFTTWHAKALSDGHDPIDASLIRAAIDGIWYNEMFGLSLPPGEIEGLLQRLEDMASRE